MDKAKSKVAEFLHKSDKHDTTVHENVKPAVTHETVKPHQHEQVTTAVDREVHQDHHHTSVQPIHDRQVLPETHHHNELPVESRDYRHGNDDHVAAKLQQEQSKFRDHTTTAPATTTRESDSLVTGEHKHHNVHEVIQPVVHKETVEPHVVHSVAKVHEKHDNPAQVHEASTLPAMNMADFKAQGGTLTGRETRTDAFEGEPRHIGGTAAGGSSVGSAVPHTNTGGHVAHTGTSSHGTHTGTGSHLPHTGTVGHGTHTDTAGHGTHTGTTGHGTHTGTGAVPHSGIAGHAPHSGTGGVPHSGTGTVGSGGAPAAPRRDSSDDGKTKPSLADKLNPKKDADGDGKPGIMS